MARKIKKVEGGHGHHGGAWKVAYADFVTAMMALFMVLWLLASTDSQSRKEISNYFRTGMVQIVELPSQGSPSPTTSVFSGAPTAPKAMGAEGDKDGTGKDGEGGDKEGVIDPQIDARVRAVQELEERLNRLAGMDDELAQVIKHVRVQLAQEGVLIEAVDEAKGLLFDLSSSKLNEPLERFLRALGPAISTLDRPVEINGHTDARPFATGAKISNWDLSYQRAEAARLILEDSGVSNKRIIGVFARGSSQLYVPNEPMAPQNRRLSILVKIAKSGDAPPPEPTTAPPN